MHGSYKSNQWPKDNATQGNGPRVGNAANKGNSSIFTQSLSQTTQLFSQGGMALTQGMSQVIWNR